jgi:hypothetical protein
MIENLEEPGATSDGGAPHPYIRLVDVPTLPWMPPSSRATVRGWAYKGVRGKKLRTECIGGLRYTTEFWLREFFAALSSACPSSVGRDGPTARTPNERLRDRERAKRELVEQAGI